MQFGPTNDNKPNAIVAMPNHVHGIIRIIGRGEWHSSKDIMGVFDTPQQTEYTINELHANDERRGERHSPDNIMGECNSPQQTENIIDQLHSFTKRGECNSPNIYSSDERGKCNSPLRGPSQTVGAIVRGYKSSVTKKLNELTIGCAVWQRNYYEHIIRNERSYINIAEYIIDNPAK
jgi:hypothetical protein